MESTNISLLDTLYGTDFGGDLEADLLGHIRNAVVDINHNVLAMGFCGNFLGSMNLNNLYYAIPRAYPVVHWPSIRPFKTVIVDETMLPFLADTWDCILALHFMEFSGSGRGFLKEAFRTLKTGGKLVVVSLNKHSFKAFPKNGKKRIKHEIRDIIRFMSSEMFRITSISCATGQHRFWPYCFSYNLDDYGSMLVSALPLLADVVVLTAEKCNASPEMIKSLDSQYA